MGEIRNIRCKKDEYLVQWPDGHLWCASRKTEFISFSGCGGNTVPKDDPDGFGFCAPCQTVEYSCPPETSTVQTQNVCPAGDAYQSSKYENEVWQEAKQFSWALVDRGCTIHTGGIFKDWARLIQRFKDNRCESIKLLCKDYVATYDGEGGRDGYYYGDSYCPERDKASWEVAVERTIKKWIAEDKGCEVISPPKAKQLYESIKSKSKEGMAVGSSFPP